MNSYEPPSKVDCEIPFFSIKKEKPAVQYVFITGGKTRNKAKCKQQKKNRKLQKV